LFAEEDPTIRTAKPRPKEAPQKSKNVAIAAISRNTESFQAHKNLICG
jgi:hypothetical protein